MTGSPVKPAIQALERLLNEEEGRAPGKHVVMFQVFVDQRKVGGIASFFLNTVAANNYYDDLIRRIEQQALATDRRATRAIVALHDKHHEWNREAQRVTK